MDVDRPMTPGAEDRRPSAPARRRSGFATFAAVGVALSVAVAACSGSGGSQSPGGAGAGSAGGGSSAAASTDTGAGGSAAAGGSGGASAFQPPATKVSLRLWNGLTGPDGQAFNKIVDQFNSETPNVQVTVETQPGAEFQQRLEAAASANQVPQLM